MGRCETLLNRLSTCFFSSSLTFVLISPIKMQLITQHVCVWHHSLWDSVLLSAQWFVLLEARQPYLWVVSTWQFDSQFKAIPELQGTPQRWWTHPSGCRSGSFSWVHFQLIWFDEDGGLIRSNLAHHLRALPSLDEAHLHPRRFLTASGRQKNLFETENKRTGNKKK